jgi:hypothetical protein
VYQNEVEGWNWKVVKTINECPFQRAQAEKEGKNSTQNQASPSSWFAKLHLK